MIDFDEGQLPLMKSLSAKLATIRNRRRGWEGGGWDGDGKDGGMGLFFWVFSVFSKSRHRFGSAAKPLVIHIHFRILHTIVWSTLTRRHWSKKTLAGETRDGTKWWTDWPEPKHSENEPYLLFLLQSIFIYIKRPADEYGKIWPIRKNLISKPKWC